MKKNLAQKKQCFGRIHIIFKWNGNWIRSWTHILKNVFESGWDLKSKICIYFLKKIMKISRPKKYKNSKKKFSLKITIFCVLYLAKIHLILTQDFRYNWIILLNLSSVTSRSWNLRGRVEVYKQWGGRCQTFKRKG